MRSSSQISKSSNASTAEFIYNSILGDPGADSEGEGKSKQAEK